MTHITTFRLVHTVDGRITCAEFTGRFVTICAMLKLGHVFIGDNWNPKQRAELQGAPKFEGVHGPMWDGDAIRYECPATYKHLST